MRSADHYTTVLNNNTHSQVKQTPELWNITHTHTHTSASICRYRTPSAFYVWWRKSLLSLSLSLYFPLVLDLPPVSSPLSFILPHLFYLPLVILLSHSALRSSLPSQLFLRPHPWPASFPDGIAPPGVIPAPKTPSSTRACDYSTRNSKTNLRAKSRATVSEQKTLTNKDAIPLFILCLCSHFKASAYVTYRWPFSNPPFRPMTAFFQAAQLFSALANMAWKSTCRDLKLARDNRSIKTSSHLQICFVFSIQCVATRLKKQSAWVDPSADVKTESSRTPEGYRPDRKYMCVKKLQGRSTKDMFQVQGRKITDARHKLTKSNLLSKLHESLHPQVASSGELEGWTVLDFCR